MPQSRRENDRPRGEGKPRPRSASAKGHSAAEKSESRFRHGYRPGRAEKPVSAPANAVSAAGKSSPVSRRGYRPGRPGKAVSAPANVILVSGTDVDANAGLPNLTKYLSTSGAASRRHAAELIKDGHVSVNGAVCTDPSVRIAPGDRVTLDGRPVEPPRGYVRSEEHTSELQSQ